MHLLDHVRDTIARHGWFCTAVFPVEGNEGMPFAYSSGFQQSRAQPDIVIVGFDHMLCHALLAQLHSGMADGSMSIPEEGGLMQGVIRNFPVKFAPLAPATIAGFARTTTAINGAEPTMMQQMILPDQNGLFPGDPGCDERYARMQDIRLVLEDQDEDPSPS